jgi:YARHG domain
MRSLFAITVLSIVLFLPVSNTLADSCYDLWYQRNLIYAQNGYCFSSSLARRTFSEFSCWTNNPQFTLDEQRHINQIKAEERRLGCKVNQ